MKQFARLRDAYELWSSRQRTVGWRAALRLRGLEKSHAKERLMDWPVIEIRPPGSRRGLWMRSQESSSDFAVAEDVFRKHQYEVVADLTGVRSIVDCGANVGYASSYLLDRHPAARLIAVEPASENVALCRRNLTVYGERAKVIHGAVWPRSGTVEVQRQGWGDEREWAIHVAEASASAVETVPAIPMGDLLAEAGGVLDLLKMDIEGAEGPLFSGDISWLGHVRNLVIEIHGPEREVIVRRAMADFESEMSQCGELTVYRNVRRPIGSERRAESGPY
jgi:FkbM family methyltransferase